MGNPLLSSLMSELPGHLHFMPGLLEGSLVSCDINHVARPGEYAHQLMGVVKQFIPGQALALGVITTEDKALSGAQ